MKLINLHHLLNINKTILAKEIHGFSLMNRLKLVLKKFGENIQRIVLSMTILSILEVENVFALIVPHNWNQLMVIQYTLSKNP